MKQFATAWNYGPLPGLAYGTKPYTEAIDHLVAAQWARSIIVVDDQPDIRDLIAQTLTDEGYDVTAFDDGQAVVDQAITNPPRLILLDLMMPKMSGWQVLTALKSVRISANIPVVLVSASRDLPQTARQFSVEYLPKPFDLDDLITVVWKCAGPP